MASRRPSVAAAAIALSAVTGCMGGRGPTAYRVRADENDVFQPNGEIHFVEDGVRSRGVLVTATPGFENAFKAGWSCKLVPLSPNTLPGPMWTGKATAEQAVAIASLPSHRDTFDVELRGNVIRSRLGELSVWVLGTRPFVLGLAAGTPVRTWREYARSATGVDDRYALDIPLPPFLSRFVVDAELGQPIDRLVLMHDDSRETVATVATTDQQLDVVSLTRPMPIGEALDAIAVDDPRRLGTVVTLPLVDPMVDAKTRARAGVADRERLKAWR